MCVVKCHQDGCPVKYFHCGRFQTETLTNTEAMGIGEYDAKVRGNYLSQGRLLARRSLKKAVQQGRRRVEAGGVPSGVR
jgi:hypothetical protein